MGGAENLPNIVDWALQYAGRGWRVFPLHSIKEGACTCGKPACGSPGKHPLTPKGFKDATCDPATIETWWRRWPWANIGLATGAGLVVLDVDGPKGLAELKALVARHGGLPATLTARTGNGAHLFFTDGEGIKSSARGNLHVRGEGGYVVAAPSKHVSGRQYQWTNQVTAAELEPWLREWMQQGGNLKESASAQLQRIEAPGYLERLSSGGIAAKAVQAIRRLDSTTFRQNLDRIRSALAAIDPNPYDPWFKVGMICQDAECLTEDGVDLGFEAWNGWSERSPKYPGREALLAKYQTFGRSKRADGLTLNSLFRWAKDAGWQGTIEVHANVNGADSVDATLPPGFNQPNPIVFRDLDKSGNKKATCANAWAAIKLLGIQCSKDVFKQQPLIEGQLIQEYAGSISDDVILAIRRLIYERFGFDAGQVNTMHAALQECLANQFDPVLDYFDSLQWDGKPRLRTWLRDYLGADETALNAAIGTLMLVAAVRRAEVPGAKFDQIVVLEGPEGTGKSMAIQILAGDDYFSDKSILAVGDREQQESVRGVLLYEISELAGMRHTEVERIKAFASRTEDRARPAYAHFQENLKRRCIFIGTTNNDAYLKSDSGNRRFWPVMTRRIDLEGLRAARDQLWAEACTIEREGNSVMLDRKLWSEATREQEKRMEYDEWFARADKHVNGATLVDDLSLDDLLSGSHFMMKAAEINQITQTRAARQLKRLGFERYHKRVGETFQWRYRRNAGNVVT